MLKIRQKLMSNKMKDKLSKKKKNYVDCWIVLQKEIIALQTLIMDPGSA